MKKIMLSLILIGLAKAASSYPIDPRPLRRLVMESEFIIVGHVVEIQQVKQKDESWGPTTIARIKVIEVLKGNVREEIVDVPYNANFICPAPAHYEAETTVLAFLNKGKDDRYHTHALSYGAKTLSVPDIAIYKTRIQEMQQILTIVNEDTKFMQTVEWLVKCTEQQATRWEGTYELSPESDFMSFYSRSEKEPFKYLLSEDQKLRLKRTLLETTESQYCDFGLVDLVFPSNESEIRPFLIKGLKNIDERQLWMADAYMTRLMYGKDSREMEKLVEQFSDLQFKENADKKLKEIVAEFILLAEK